MLSAACENGCLAPMVKLVDTADLKSAAFLNKGRAGSTPARGTIESGDHCWPLAAFSRPAWALASVINSVSRLRGTCDES